MKVTYNKKTTSQLYNTVIIKERFIDLKIWQIQAFFYVFIIGFSSVLVGCVQKKNNSYIYNEPNLKAEITDVSIPPAKTKRNHESLENSYARRAAKGSSLCPKLLQRDIDNPVITRKHEHMRGKYCDYYLYPKVEQTLNINSYDADVEVVLVMPETYDFANGSYLVKESRRHVVRVRYDGVKTKPSNFKYNIDFNLE